MKKVLTFLVMSIYLLGAFAQQELQQRPRLVVGIMVDQMRWDYLVRYNDRYGEGGFKRMMEEGYNCNRLLINYIPTVTAVGHTAVYTGTVPAFNGIIANSLYFDGQWATPVRDWNVQGVGTQRTEGKASPHRLLCTTMSDELRLATNFRSKVISVSIKDRASVLPGGHCANAAYWMDSESMDFISSTYYMKELPQWVKDFNAKKLGQHYLDKAKKEKKDKKLFWNLLYDADTYVQSAGLDEPYYAPSTGSILKYLPYGNTYTADMAMAAIEHEHLGQNPTGMTDFLAISFSCTDMIGHKVGPNAPWIEDTYLRLDQDLKRLFDKLDSTVGKGEWVAFLSADHAGSHNVQFRREHGIPAETWPYYQVIRELNETLTREFGLETSDPSMQLSINKKKYEATLLIHSLECQNVFFNDTVIAKVCKDGDPKALKERLKARTIELLMQKENVAYAFDVKQMPPYIPEPVRTMAINGYHPKRSGDIVIVLEGNVTEDYDDGYKSDYKGIPIGTNHSVWSPYDAHIPFIVMGKGVRHAWDNRTYHIVDIAPTICALLNIQQPSSCVGHAIDVRK